MKELKEKLKIWNSILIETGNYQDLEIEGVKNCLGLADYILDFFLSEGKILEFNTSGIKNNLKPIPLSHLGKNNSWIFHYVASDLRSVYCPILGEPIIIKDYGKEVFGESLKYKIYSPSSF
jgi:hypothetical protein